MEEAHILFFGRLDVLVGKVQYLLLSNFRISD